MTGITTVKLGGEDRVIDLNLHCMFFLMKELSCGLNELEIKVLEQVAENPLRGIGYIVYCGIKGHKEAEAEFNHNITLKEVMQWIGKSEATDDFERLIELFKQVNEMPAEAAQVAEYNEEVKKKQE